MTQQAYEYAEVWVDDFPQEAVEYGLDEDGPEEES